MAIKPIIIIFSFCIFFNGLYGLSLSDCINAAIKNSYDIKQTDLDIKSYKLSLKLKEQQLYGWNAIWTPLGYSERSFPNDNEIYFDRDFTYNIITSKLTVQKTIWKYLTLKTTTKNTISKSHYLMKQVTLPDDDPLNINTTLNRFDNTIELLIPIMGYSTKKYKFNEISNNLTINKNTISANKKYKALVTNVTDLYMDILMIQNLIKIYQEETDILNKLISLQKLQLNKGKITLIDFQKNELNVEDKNLTIKKNNNRKKLLITKLKEITKLPISNQTIFEGRLSLDTYKKDIQKVYNFRLNNDYSLKNMELDEKLINNEINEIKSKYMPELSLNLKYNLSGLGKGDNLIDAYGNLKSGYSAYLSFNLPFLNSNIVKTKIEKKELEKIQIATNIEKRKEFIKYEMVALNYKLNELYSDYISINKKIDLANKNINIASLQYKQGTFDKTDLLQLRLSLLNLERNKINIIVSYNKQKNKLISYEQDYNKYVSKY